jgi:Phosphotransferase enzyme family
MATRSSDDAGPPGLRDHLRRLVPGARLVAIEPLAADTGAGAGGATAKATGYGKPVRITLEDEAGARRELVWRTATANDFGHDRPSDRAAAMLLAFDDFARTPRHVEALDVGAVTPGGLVSVPGGAELYLITSYARGTIYADDLRRIAAGGVATELDLARVGALARYLADLHHRPGDRPEAYVRAIRDLVGHGEGIYGVVDNYPADTPAAPPARLRAIEQRCADWRWRLRGHEARLARTHGDFHPFNVVFAGGTELTLLDASRGGQGDPADDVTAMAVNFPFFALDRPDAWARGLGPLWRRFWSAYLEARPDDGLAAAAPPFLAWRGLVVCNPRFYPTLSAGARDTMLGLVERVLDAGRLDPAWVEELFG